IVGGLVVTGSSTIAPIAWVGSESPIGMNVLPPSLLIHTPPLAAPTKSRPGVVGSAAIAVIRPVALNGAPTITPPKFDKAFSIGWGPMKFQVGRSPCRLPACAASITCIWASAFSYAPVGTPTWSPGRRNQSCCGNGGWGTDATAGGPLCWEDDGVKKPPATPPTVMSKAKSSLSFLPCLQDCLFPSMLASSD